MCIYEYSNGKCAHPKNLSLECVGEEKCVHMDDGNAVEEVEKALDESFGNELEPKDTCSNTQCGLYCEKYQRFYCAGEENCREENEYFEHMKTYGGIDIGESEDRIDKN